MSKGQRAFALIIAVVFLGTAVVSGVAVLWQIIADNREPEQANEQTLEQEEGDMLQGTKLAGFDPISDVTELQIIDLEEGDGEEVKTGAAVTAHFTGALTKDGTIFQSSYDFGEPIDFSLNEVLQGWREGVPGMKVGGKRRLIIPADLAYGAAGSPPTIGPDEPLVFDIELTAVKNP